MSLGDVLSAAVPQRVSWGNTETTDVQHMAEELKSSQWCCASPVTSVIQFTNLTRSWKKLALVGCGVPIYSELSVQLGLL